MFGASSSTSFPAPADRTHTLLSTSSSGGDVGVSCTFHPHFCLHTSLRYQVLFSQPRYVPSGLQKLIWAVHFLLTQKSAQVSLKQLSTHQIGLNWNDESAILLDYCAACVTRDYGTGSIPLARRRLAPVMSPSWDLSTRLHFIQL